MIQILFGSQTGNAQNLASIVHQSLSESGFRCEVNGFEEHSPELIHDLNFLIIVTSTYGDGEAPDNASEWHSFLKFSEKLNLLNLHYAVLGLGDTYYPHFCQCGKDFDEFLEFHGAHKMLERIDCDTYYEEQYGPWLIKLIEVLKDKAAP